MSPSPNMPETAVQFIEAHATDFLQGIETKEHMKCEQLRLNTFKPWPPRRKNWPSALARAGFFYDPENDMTECFVCGITISGSDWESRQNVLLKHKTSNPRCEYVSGDYKEHIPFQSLDQRRQKRPYLHQTSGPTLEEFIHERNNGVYESDSNRRIAAPTENHIASMPNDPNRDSLYTSGSTSEPPFQSLPVIPAGRQAGTPITGGLRTDSAAPTRAQGLSAGSTNNNRNLQNSINGAATTSGPVSLPTGRQTSTPITGGLRTDSAAPTRAQGLSAASTDNNRNLQNIINGTTTTSGPVSLPTGRDLFDGDVDPLRRMKSEAARLETFARWPNGAAITGESLAKAGFFYTLSADRVQCAFCENVLRNWEAGDDAMTEHRRHFPRCRFVLGLNVGNIPISAERRMTPQRNPVSIFP